MACQIGSTNLQWRLSIKDNESSGKSCIALATSRIHSCCCEPSFSGITLRFGRNSSPFPQSCVLAFLQGFKMMSATAIDDWGRNVLAGFGRIFSQLSALVANAIFMRRRAGWKIAFALDTGGVSGNGDQQNLNDVSSSFGGTRLGRILTAGGRQLLEKLNSARKNFPMKIFLLLLGFYTANALATILGQTGDWDVLVAGIVVAAIEGIGMLMYKKPPNVRTGRLQSFLMMMNYWKAGICLGLFVDAFKLGS